MAGSSVLVVCDFDGTLVDVDVGNELCVRFAAPHWRSVIDRYYAGELSLPEAQRTCWSLIDMAIASLREQALAFASLRAGAEGLFEAAREGRCRLVIASGGFGFYIEALLGDRLRVDFNRVDESVFYRSLAIVGEDYATLPAVLEIKNTNFSFEASLNS